MSPRKQTIGFAGLGRMGVPMATNLASAGFPLVVWNRNAEKAHALARKIGCEVADQVADLVERCDLLVTMVADGDALGKILFSDPAVLAALKGKLVLDMSTTGPTFAVELARRLADAGVRFVESPVSGSTTAARAATLALLVGAEPEDLDRVRGVLEAMGGEIRHLGPPGAASLAKLAINNLIFGINQCVSESLGLAERGGLEREAIYDAFLASAAAAPVLNYRRDAFLHPGEGEVSFTLELAEKDLRLTIELADLLGAPMPQAELNRRVASDAIAAGLGQEDLAIVAQHLRHVADQMIPANQELRER